MGDVRSISDFPEDAPGLKYECCIRGYIYTSAQLIYHGQISMKRFSFVGSVPPVVRQPSQL